jgi:hypothetical protein
MKPNHLAQLILLFIPLMSASAMAQDKPSITVTSNNQQGGITAYQVNIGRIDLSFNSEIAAEVTKRIPKDKPIDLRAVGSPKDWQIAAQYAGYLQANGYSFRNSSQTGMLVPPPDGPITITTFPDHTDLLISPRS